MDIWDFWNAHRWPQNPRGAATEIWVLANFVHLRLAQYISRFIVLHTTDMGMGKTDLILRLKKLEVALSDARKRKP